jgi:serine/threonine-protein kinase
VDGDSSSTLTEEGWVVGTPDYLAPEQASDPRKADTRSDLYSLGCTLYFLLAGRPPFPFGSPTDKVIKHAMLDPLPVEVLRPDVPESLAAVLHKLLAKKPEDRYQTPAEVVAALAALRGLSDRPPPATGAALPASEGGVSTAPTVVPGPGAARGKAPLAVPAEPSNPWSQVTAPAAADAAPAAPRPSRTDRRSVWRPLIAGGVGLTVCLALLAALVLYLSCSPR